MESQNHQSVFLFVIKLERQVVQIPSSLLLRKPPVYANPSIMPLKGQNAYVGSSLHPSPLVSMWYLAHLIGLGLCTRRWVVPLVF